MFSHLWFKSKQKKEFKTWSREHSNIVLNNVMNIWVWKNWQTRNLFVTPWICNEYSKHQFKWYALIDFILISALPLLGLPAHRHFMSHLIRVFLFLDTRQWHSPERLELMARKSVTFRKIFPHTIHFPSLGSFWAQWTYFGTKLFPKKIVLQQSLKLSHIRQCHCHFRVGRNFRAFRVLYCYITGKTCPSGDGCNEAFNLLW